MATDDSSDINEEELLDYSCSSDCDDALSLGVSDAGDLLDDDSLYESVVYSSNSQTVFKPSQRNPITAPKPHITPITAPDPVPTTTSLSLHTSQVPPACKLFPVKRVKTTRITSTPAMVCKKQLPCHATSQQRSPVGAPGVSKHFQRSPVKAPNSHKATINTTKRSKRMLPRVTSIAEDFVFTTSTKSPVVTSDSEESSDDMPYCSRYYNARIRDSEPYSCYDQGRQESHTMEPPLSLVKDEVLSASSDNSKTNPFSLASSADDGSSFSFRETASQRQCRSLDSSPLVCTTNGSSSPGNPFSPPRDSPPVGLTAHRMKDYGESNSSTAQGDRTRAMRRKSKIIKLNQSKVFRYVPEDLPEVELPNLASKKRAMRKRGNTFPGDDCPDLLLETKRHVREGDLRSVLTTQRSSAFNDEGLSPSESQKKVTRAISCPHCTSSPIKLDVQQQPSREAHSSRPHSPIVAPSARVTQTLTSASFKLNSHLRAPLSSPTKSPGLAIVPTTSLQERTFAAGMSDDLHLQKRLSTDATVHSSPVKSTTAQSNNSSAPLQPARNFFKNHTDSLSPMKKVPSAVSEPTPSSDSECKPSIFRQCVSIFAQRPNLMGRSSPGRNQFSLRHLDGPMCRSFALDHL